MDLDLRCISLGRWELLLDLASLVSPAHLRQYIGLMLIRTQGFSVYWRLGRLRMSPEGLTFEAVLTTFGFISG